MSNAENNANSIIGITGRTKIVGVWGCPVGHSRSPMMHNAALKALGLDWAYVPFEVAPDDLGAAVNGLRAMGILGVNVTVPLKERVLPYLDSVDAEAARVGSVNTIYVEGGRLRGCTTDGAGFLRAIQDAGQETRGRRALILGAGGSARAVAFALAAEETVCYIANRTQARAEALAGDVNRWFPQRAIAVNLNQDAGPYDLVVNTTSAGMAPQEDALPPLPPNALAAGPFVMDLIYAPSRTRLLAQAHSAGCETANGVAMLVRQGALSLALWTGLPAAEMPLAGMEAAVRASL